MPSDNRATMRIIDYRDGLTEIASVDLPDRVDGPVLAEGTGEKARFIVRLRDGSIVVLMR